jgi:hypothetical protein
VNAAYEITCNIHIAMGSGNGFLWRKLPLVLSFFTSSCQLSRVSRCDFGSPSERQTKGQRASPL